MKTLIHLFLGMLLMSFATAPGFSQDTKKPETKADEDQQESPRTKGLRKIAGHSHRDWDFNLDEEALEANIEKAVDRAMKSVDVALEKMEISLRHLDRMPIDIRIPNIDIEPIEVNIPRIDVDIDRHFRHHHDWDDENDRKDKSHKDKSHKDKSDKKNSQGLKKIN